MALSYRVWGSQFQACPICLLPEIVYFLNSLKLQKKIICVKKIFLLSTVKFHAANSQTFSRYRQMAMNKRFNMIDFNKI